jgi:hypothetical protein
MMFFADFFVTTLTFVFLVAVFFAFDEIILNGYFATKLRKRFNVEDLK